jgi:hypothetical protein
MGDVVCHAHPEETREAIGCPGEKLSCFIDKPRRGKIHDKSVAEAGCNLSSAECPHATSAVPEGICMFRCLLKAMQISPPTHMNFRLY